MYYKSFEIQSCFQTLSDFEYPAELKYILSSATDPLPPASIHNLLFTVSRYRRSAFYISVNLKII